MQWVVHVIKPGGYLRKRTIYLLFPRKTCSGKAADQETFKLAAKILRIRKLADFREIEMNNGMRFLFPELFDREALKIPQLIAEQGIKG